MATATEQRNNDAQGISVQVIAIEPLGVAA